jgi:hypothetical protein
VEVRNSTSRRDSIVAKPGQTELITSSKHNHGGRGSHDIRESKRKLDSRMHGLTGLGARRQVSTSNDKKATRPEVLAMRHISMLAELASGR